ncbi:MAG: TspO/MBR family protein [Patescibacteria group bacterium]
MAPIEWYDNLIKPDWAPPASLFGLVWTILYIIILVSFTYAVWLYFSGKIKRKLLLPFFLNLIFNLIFPSLQFGLHNLWLGMFDIIFIIITLVWIMHNIYPRSKFIYYAQFPYLLWVIFAGCLQLAVIILN